MNVPRRANRGTWRWSGWAGIGIGLALGTFASPPPNASADSRLPSSSEDAKLREVGRRRGASVAVVGDPNRGQGTGFLISREHRLVATAAHVADLYRGPNTIWAVFNGTAEPRSVTRVWYHPGLMRSLDEGLVVRSPDPNDGPVRVPGPDVAVIQLAEGGSPLPEAWEIAGPAELLDLDERPVALLGFPGYGEWPTEERPAPATMREGIIREVESYDFLDGAHPERRQMIEHTAAAPEGSSGSPLFLTNGHVAAVHNILRLEGFNRQNRSGMSVRIDAIWELLAFHGLDQWVGPPPDDWTVLVPADPALDPRRDDLRRAVALLRESIQLGARKDFDGAGKKANAAIQLAPEYASAYFQRSRVYLGYCTANWATLSAKDRVKYSQWATADVQLGCEIDPGREDGICLLLQNWLYFGRIENDRAVYEKIIAEADWFLALPRGDTYSRSFLTNIRAQSRHYLGDYEGALRDYNESIRISPQESTWYVNRAQFWENRGRADLAANDRRIAAGL